MQILANVKISEAVEPLLIEAHRRLTTFAKKRDGKKLETAWVGLGFATTYKPAVAAGLMRPLSRYARRCLGWYLFTPTGLKVYRAWLKQRSV